MCIKYQISCAGQIISIAQYDICDTQKIITGPEDFAAFCAIPIWSSMFANVILRKPLN